MENLIRAGRSFRNALLVIAGFSFFATMLQLTIPLYMLQIYDRVLPSNSRETLVFLSVLAALALIMLGITEAVRQFLGHRASSRFDTHLSNDVMEEIIRTGHETDGNVQRLRDLHTVRNLVGSKILMGVVDLPFASIFIVCMFFIHPHLFWLTIAGAAILMGIALINRALAARPTREQSAAQFAVSREAEFLSRNSDSILAMGMLGNVLGRWGNTNAAALIASDDSSRVNSSFSGLSRTIRFGLQAAVLGYGAYLVQEGEMTAGMIFAASILSGRALQPLDVVINSWPTISAGRAARKRLFDFLEKKKPQQAFTQMAPPKGQVKLVNVLQPNPLNPKNRPLLNRIKFEIPAGVSVAVVGASGSGKSTLARVMVGALKPAAGSVRLDGNDIANWNLEDLGRYIGYLAQDVELLPGTIAQNISRFEPDPDDATIRQAAEMAHVDAMIKDMPNGYDTLIGPGGLSISGGEKQRIALARAFYGSPRLLVLDEPNASLDAAGEVALIKAMQVAKQNGITLVLVTQRSNVLSFVDRIMEMNAGRVVEYRDREDYFNVQLAKKKKLEELQGAGAGAGTGAARKAARKGSARPRMPVRKNRSA